jgi:hypothetical protein
MRLSISKGTTNADAMADALRFRSSASCCSSSLCANPTSRNYFSPCEVLSVRSENRQAGNRDISVITRSPHSRSGA